MTEPYTNALACESSLYLQQHAHNPVNWFPWSEEAWLLAKKENKLVLVSIGYSSCHWCHVMEKETFMDSATARIMNDNFICIKVDREERPDIDQVYMNAVQLMTGAGGWPLNCFTLPDSRPIFGGTYFPKLSWDDILIKLKDFYKENPRKAEQYAEELLSGINNSELISVKKNSSLITNETFQNAMEGWKSLLDTMNGGPNRAPKFPLPGNYQFLLRSATNNQDIPLLDHVKLTLKKMAFGGIYDQLAGGFSRYSTDSLWKVPHFEKMLYDNAQLVSLYSSAYKLTHDDLSKQIAVETIDFLKSEMSDGSAGYFSSYDADSEGEEGKYYVWTIEEIKNIKLPVCGNANSFDVFSDYFNFNEKGLWEKGNYILLRKSSDADIAKKYSVSVSELKNFIAQSKLMLREIRNKRIPPSLDKKIITSWNSLLITALCDAYQAFGDEKYRDEAIKCMEGILKYSIKEAMILHVRSQKNNIKSGYLEDYAFTVSALINIYQITFDERWILKARTFTDDAIKYFYDGEDGFFWFTSTKDTPLIARKKETMDNVIPASNSEMANVLFKLGDYFDDKKYTEMSLHMLVSIQENILKYPSSYSNWANLMMNFTQPFVEVVITGSQAEEKRKTISRLYLPEVIFAGSSKNGCLLPMLENRFQKGKSLIYICSNKTCKLPIENTDEAVELLKHDSQKLRDAVNY